ncbi:hypothetical protein [Aquimarina algiphila]|uniref:hypothetical protein n=1 Tax=Aquimarina algiphila TaxID=2047982 RepID=UPI00232A7EFB|nr:hypothetical protein [Aquimarina algiphila]
MQKTKISNQCADNVDGLVTFCPATTHILNVVKHLKKLIYILSIILIQASCSDSNQKKRTVTETRFLSGISNDSLKIRTEYKLVKTITDSVMEFDYISVTDSTRNFSVSFKKHQSELILGFTRYKINKNNDLNNIIISNYQFESYIHITPEIDGMGPILFNQNYGILAIGNPLGPAAAFTKNKPKFEVVNEIFEKLF